MGLRIRGERRRTAVSTLACLERYDFSGISSAHNRMNTPVWCKPRHRGFGRMSLQSDAPWCFLSFTLGGGVFDFRVTRLVRAARAEGSHDVEVRQQL